MKPIFCVDITYDKKNETVNGDEFITKRASQKTTETLESSFEDLEQTVEKTKLPLALRVVRFVSGMLALIVLLATLKALPEVSFSEILENGKWLIAFGVACGVLWIVLTLVAKTKEKIVLQDSHLEQQTEELDEYIEDVYASLEVPEDAPNVDVFAFNYTVKEGSIVPETSMLETVPFLNIDMRVYVRDGFLHLADLELVHSFPLDELKMIQTVKKRISIDSWNKDEKISSKAFKPYKLTEDKYGNVYMKTYYVLEGERNGEAYGIYFPCYELPVFEHLTGLTAEE